jgi:antitoxin CcdA
MGKAELSVDPELLEQAAAAGLNVDLLIERALRLALQKADPAGAEARAAKWAEENAQAIQDYNRRIRERGVFSDGVRTW